MPAKPPLLAGAGHRSRVTDCWLLLARSRPFIFCFLLSACRFFPPSAFRFPVSSLAHLGPKSVAVDRFDYSTASRTTSAWWSAWAWISDPACAARLSSVERVALRPPQKERRHLAGGWPRSSISVTPAQPRLHGFHARPAAVVLIGQREALAKAVKNNQTEQRISGRLARLTSKAVTNKRPPAPSYYPLPRPPAAPPEIPPFDGPCGPHFSSHPGNWRAPFGRK